MSPYTNGPFWSLSYEFWYYVLFGSMVFCKGIKWKLSFILICSLICGPNILLLLPIWLLGVGIYFLNKNKRLIISKTWAIQGFILSVGCFVIFAAKLPDFPRKVLDPPLLFSSAFASDWLIGITVAGMILCFEKAWPHISVPRTVEAGISWTAKHTFSLYLFHFPLIFFFNLLGFLNPLIWWQGLLEVVLILAIIFALSEVTESKRKALQQGITKFWDNHGRFLGGAERKKIMPLHRNP